MFGNFWLAYDLCCIVLYCRGEFTEYFAEIGQIMEEHFDRERESSSSSSDSESSESGKSSNSSSNSSSSNSGRKKKKNGKSKKRKNKKTKYSKKKVKNPKKPPKQACPASKHPGAKEECPIHGMHIWEDCRLNPRSKNYDPSKAYSRNNAQLQNEHHQGQNTRNQNFQNRNNNQRQNQGQNPGQQAQHHHYLN